MAVEVVDMVVSWLSCNGSGDGIDMVIRMSETTVTTASLVVYFGPLTVVYEAMSKRSFGILNETISGRNLSISKRYK